MGFDVGAFLANVLMAFFAQDGYDGDRSAQQKWLLECLVCTWRVFETRFIQLWE